MVPQLHLKLHNLLNRKKNELTVKHFGAKPDRRQNVGAKMYRRQNVGEKKRRQIDVVKVLPPDFFAVELLMTHFSSQTVKFYPSFILFGWIVHIN